MLMLLPEDKTTSIAVYFPLFFTRPRSLHLTILSNSLFTSLLSFRRKCKETRYREAKSFSSNANHLSLAANHLSRSLLLSLLPVSLYIFSTLHCWLLTLPNALHCTTRMAAHVFKFHITRHVRLPS